MKLLVIFGKPYFQVTIEEGISNEDCIRKALTKFNERFITGSKAIWETIQSNAIKNADKKDGNFEFTLSGYEWDIRTYDDQVQVIADEKKTLMHILYEIQAETAKKSNELIMVKKLALYEQLKKELGK